MPLFNEGVAWGYTFEQLATVDLTGQVSSTHAAAIATVPKVWSRTSIGAPHTINVRGCKAP